MVHIYLKKQKVLILHFSFLLICLTTLPCSAVPDTRPESQKKKSNQTSFFTKHKFLVSGALITTGIWIGSWLERFKKDLARSIKSLPAVAGNGAKNPANNHNDNDTDNGSSNSHDNSQKQKHLSTQMPQHQSVSTQTDDSLIQDNLSEEEEEEEKKKKCWNILCNMLPNESFSRLTTHERFGQLDKKRWLKLYEETKTKKDQENELYQQLFDDFISNLPDVDREITLAESLGSASNLAHQGPSPATRAWSYLKKYNMQNTPIRNSERDNSLYSPLHIVLKRNPENARLVDNLEQLETSYITADSSQKTTLSPFALIVPSDTPASRLNKQLIDLFIKKGFITSKAIFDKLNAIEGLRYGIHTNPFKDDEWKKAKQKFGNHTATTYV